MILLLKVSIFVLGFAILYSNAIEVSTRSGVIIGSDLLRSRRGNKVIYSFTGIPYAQPPIGKLRFKEPEPVEPWVTPLNATGECPICPQIKLITLGKDSNPNSKIKGQEDCLRINVRTPTLDPKAKLPVMVSIHGGAYKIGNAGFEPQFLLPDVVLTDITYRLGGLGFSTTGDGVIPGNLGLKDQVMALRWIHQNIEKFGGDPNLVTVFGTSAGGSSAHLLILSPLTKGLIHRAISSSGTAACPWAMVPREIAVARTKQMATLNGCPSQPSKALLECLQQIPVTNILESLHTLHDDFRLPHTELAPVVEEPNAEYAILKTDPRNIKSQIPWITGINAAEHLGYANVFLKTVDKNKLNITEQFDSFLIKWLSYGFNVTMKEIPAIARQIKNFYFGKGNQIRMENIGNLDKVIADGWFLKGIVDAVPIHEGPTYLYYYDYEQSDTTTFKSIIGYGAGDGKGAGHMDEVLSLFPWSTVFPSRSLSQLDLQISEKMVSLWTKFAKYGNFPTNEWSLVQKGSVGLKNYLHISAAGFTQENYLLMDRVNFWRSLNNYQ